jgi:DNA-binding transcriptional LysR family regulator
MELRTLRSFVVLAEHAHFTRAAAELGVVQPALSKHIQTLEEELGVRLFERTRRRVRLSRAGEQLLEPARRALRAADDVLAVAREIRGGIVGHLQVGFTPTAPASLLAQAMSAFRRQHPRMACRVTQASSEELLDGLERGALDVALVRLEAAARRPAVATVPVVEEPLVVALPRRHRLARRRSIAWAQLVDEPFVMVQRRAAPVVHDQVIAACRSAGFSPVVVQHLHDVHGVLAVVGAGGGIAVVPRSTRGLPTVVFRPLVEPRLTTALGLAWMSSRAEQPAAVRDFVDIVRHATARAPREPAVGAPASARRRVIPRVDRFLQEE